MAPLESPRPSEPQGVAVVGFHRSGTSLVARLLNLLGVRLGAEEDLLPAHPTDNPRGYWEPRWANELNDEILEACGSSWLTPYGLPDDWRDTPAVAPLADRLRRELDAHLSGEGPWGWKDPRTSLTLPLWQEAVDGELRHVLCVRSPIDAVASALRRGIGGVDLQTWAALWVDYTGSALRHTEGRERLIVLYEDVLADPVQEGRRLAAFVGAEPPTPEVEQILRDEVHGELRHHATSLRDIAEDFAVPAEARAVYLLLADARARERERAGDGAASPADLVPAFQRMAAALCSSHEQRWQDAAARAILEERSDELQVRAERAEEALAEARSALATAEAEAAERLSAERIRTERQSAEADERLRAAEERFARAEAEAGELAARLEARVESAEAALASCRETLDGVYGSRSWRLTTPLRAAGDAVRTRRPGRNGA